MIKKGFYVPDGDGERVGGLPPTKNTYTADEFVLESKYTAVDPEMRFDNNTAMKVSVVIPVYNRPEMLYRILWSLWKQQDSNYEVLVSNDDDESFTEKTESVISEFRDRGMTIPSFKTGQYKRGRGWSVETYPYNVGIRKATGDIILLNSGDVLSVTNTISQHRSKHQEDSNEKSVFFSTVHGLQQDVYANIDSYPWKEDAMCLLFEGSCENMYCGQGKSYARDRSKEPYELIAPRPYHYQMSVKRDVLYALRGFDEFFYGRMPAGDDDIAMRMVKYGCTLMYTADILAIHQWHPQSNVFGTTNPDTEVSPLDYWELVAQFKPGVSRNENHEWGQFPRDMKSLGVGQ